MPVGFAHGFLTLSEHAEVLYKTTAYWVKQCERSIRWDDSQLAITWQLEALSGAMPQTSDKDAAAPFLDNLLASDLFYWRQ